MRRDRKLPNRLAMSVIAILTLSAFIVRTPEMTDASAAAVFTVTPGAPAPASPTCFPSCQPNDARFFSLAGSSLFTFAGGSTTIGIRVFGASNPTSFTVGIFDGDGGGLWDQDTAASGQDAIFELFADANSDGTPDGPALETLPAASMIDNGWAYFTVTTDPSARVGGAGTDFVYQLKASLVAPFAGLVQNNFKVAVDSTQSQLFITPQVLSFQAFQNNVAEFLIIHPSGNPHEVTPSNYDGSWNFSFAVTDAQNRVNVFNGDFDIGSIAQGSALDEDDVSTPNARPDDGVFGTEGFSLGGAMGVNPEGLGLTSDCAGPQPPGGCPPDDSNLIEFRRRSTIPGLGIVARLISPAGEFVDTNPSGNAEWELFRVAEPSAPFPAFNDFTVPNLAPGTWTYRIEGMDLANLFAVRFDRIIIVEPFLVGDTVFCDLNENGNQDPPDAGVPGVLVELVDTANNVVKTAVTNASGFYSFAVEPGTHKVRIAASNFVSGGPLAGLATTTNYGVPNERTQTLVNSNLLNYDFGYDCTTSLCVQAIGDTVWQDNDGDGFRDPGEPGIPGVTVNLAIDAQCTGSFLAFATTTTDASGLYQFTGLPSGCFRVQVVNPPGLVKTSGAAGVNDNSQANPYVLDLRNCQGNQTADFGFVASTCNLKFPSIVKARPRASISFIVSNPGGLPATVSVKPLFSSACFSIAPGFPQQVTIGAGQSVVFALNALNCPINARQFAQNSFIVIESSTCPPRSVQVEWVLR